MVRKIPRTELCFALGRTWLVFHIIRYHSFNDPTGKNLPLVACGFWSTVLKSPVQLPFCQIASNSKTRNMCYVCFISSFTWYIHTQREHAVFDGPQYDLTLSYTILSLDSMTASHDSSIPDFGGLRQAPCVKSVTYIWENTWGLILPMRNESIRGAELTGKTCLSSVIGVRKMASKSHRNGALT